MNTHNQLKRADFSQGYSANRENFDLQHATHEAWKEENKRLVTEFLAAGKPEQAVEAMRQSEWDKSMQKMGDLSAAEKVEGSNGIYVQRLDPTEAWWEFWGEVKRTLAKSGWRVKKEKDGCWNVQLYTGVEQLSYFQKTHSIKNLKYLPKGVTPMRYAGTGGRKADPLAAAKREELEAWAETGYKPSCAPIFVNI